jgi:LysR family positive regulator for ilvC
MERTTELYAAHRAVLELADTLNYTRASRNLHVAPSTLSRTIQRVEHDVGATLFERDRRRVTLTTAGERFCRHARLVLDDWADSERVMRGGGPLTGVLRLYCTVTASQTVVPDVLARFRRQHPGVHLELDTGDAAGALDRLRDERVDVSIAAVPDKMPGGVVAKVLATTPLTWIAPAGVRSVDWSHAALVLPAEGLARERADAWLRTQRPAPHVHSEVHGHEAVLSLVALGYGVGLVPGLVVEQSALRDRVTIVNGPKLSPFKVAMCTRRRSLSRPVVAALWDAV